MTKTLKIVKTEWVPKPCDICGSDSSTPVKPQLYKSPIHLPTNDGYCELKSEMVICDCCGFIFNRLRPQDDDFLRNYYRETTIEPANDYRAGARLALLNKILTGRPKTVYEIGSGDDTFINILRGEDYDAHGYDIAQEAAFKPKAVSAVLAYFVFEHVPEPRKFIRTYFNSCLSDGGYAIIEVPDYYSNRKAAMYCEHFLCFTANHLIMLMMTEGYQIVRVIQGHSRDFGIAVVAKRGIVREMKAKWDGITCQD